MDDIEMADDGLESKQTNAIVLHEKSEDSESSESSAAEDEAMSDSIESKSDIENDQAVSLNESDEEESSSQSEQEQLDNQLVKSDVSESVVQIVQNEKSDSQHPFDQKEWEENQPDESYFEESVILMDQNEKRDSLSQPDQMEVEEYQPVESYLGESAIQTDQNESNDSTLQLDQKDFRESHPAESGLVESVIQTDQNEENDSPFQPDQTDMKENQLIGSDLGEFVIQTDQNEKNDSPFQPDQTDVKENQLIGSDLGEFVMQTDQSKKSHSPLQLDQMNLKENQLYGSDLGESVIQTDENIRNDSQLQPDQKEVKENQPLESDVGESVIQTDEHERSDSQLQTDQKEVKENRPLESDVGESVIQTDEYIRSDSQLQPDQKEVKENQPLESDVGESVIQTDEYIRSDSQFQPEQKEVKETQSLEIDVGESVIQTDENIRSDSQLQTDEKEVKENQPLESDLGESVIQTDQNEANDSSFQPNQEDLKENQPTESNLEESVIQTDEKTDSPPQLDPKEQEENLRRETELNNYWKAVHENPMDFTGWTYLLQYVEQGADVEACRKAFDAFFSHYPYCYGYWKKYSDMEKRHGNLSKAVEVFEKGLRAIPLSVELWLHYITLYTAEFSSQDDFRDKMRGLYKRALAAAGLEFRSDKLWDSYINWEDDLKSMTAIYEKLISIPTQLYSHHWDKFCKHIKRYNPKDFLDPDTFLNMRSAVFRNAKHSYDEEEDIGTDDVTNAKEDAPPGMASSLTEDGKEIEKIRAHYLEVMEQIHKANEIEVSKRWTFEETIRRPYFHVKPLERGQLKIWKEYLDYEISTGNHKRIVVLFERCMIACALYEDFWMKYAKYLEQHSVDGVRSVYQRACDIHLPKKPYIHLAWAAFEERKDNYPLAHKILMNIENNVPGLAMVCMRRISLERRKGNHETAEELFKAYIQKAVSHKARTFFSIKYARYLQKVMGDIDKARNVLEAALDLDNMNERVFLQLLDLEYQAQPVDEERVHGIFDKIFEGSVSTEFKIKVSQRRMEFLEDFGTCIQKISDAYDEHQKLVKEVSSKKKKPEKDERIEEPPAKKIRRIEVAATPAPTAPPVPTPAPPPPAPVHIPVQSQAPAPAPPPMSYSPMMNNMHSNVPQQYPSMTVQPPPPPPVDNTMYAYGPWSNTGYANNNMVQPGMYPGYQYQAYPQQPYGYYGYQ